MQENYGPYIWYFVWSLVLGLALAVLYDLIKLLRRMTKAGVPAVNLGDILFAAVTGIGILCVSYFANNGVLRVYAVLSVMLGFIIYRIIFGSRIVDALSAAASLLGKVMRCLLKWVLMPVRRICSLVGKPFIITIGSAKQKIRKKIQAKFVKMPK